MSRGRCSRTCVAAAPALDPTGAAPRILDDARGTGAVVPARTAPLDARAHPSIPRVHRFLRVRAGPQADEAGLALALTKLTGPC